MTWRSEAGDSQVTAWCPLVTASPGKGWTCSDPSWGPRSLRGERTWGQQAALHPYLPPARSCAHKTRDSLELGDWEACPGAASGQGSEPQQQQRGGPGLTSGTSRCPWLCQLLSWGTEGKSLMTLSKIPRDPSRSAFPDPHPHVSACIIYEGIFTGPLP